MIVGHVPHNLAQQLLQVLRREVNKAFAEVTGTKEEDMDLRCCACTDFMDHRSTLKKMDELVISLKVAGLL